MGSCRDLKGSVVKSVVLLIDLSAATVENRDDLAEKVLKSGKVRKAIHEAFREQAGKIAAASLTGTAMDAATAKAFLAPIGKQAGPATLQAVKKQPEYKDVEAGLKDLKCAFDKTPVGAFVDRNSTWLIVAGVVMAAGGAVLMYKTRSGDLPAKGLTALTELAASKIQIGKVVSLDAKGLTFVPSKREVKSTLGINFSEARTVKMRFEVKSVVDGRTLKELSIGDSVVVPLTGSTSLTGKAGMGMKDGSGTYDMSLGVKYSQGALVLDVTAYAKGAGASQTYGGKASAGYQVSTPMFGKDSLTTVGASSKLEGIRDVSKGSSQTVGAVNVGLTTTFW